MITLDIGKSAAPKAVAPDQPGAPLVPVGHVQVYCEDPPTSLVCLLGDEPVVVKGGYGGWEVVGRPRQVGMTLWSGVEPYQAQLPLMLDGFTTADANVERALRRLSRIARGDDDSEPGVVQVGGVPLPADEWIIEALELGDPIRAVDGLALVRQPLTLTLREFVPPEFVQFRRGARRPAKRSTRIVTARDGETVIHLARRIKVKWTDLRKLNPKLIKRANQKLKKGAKVLAPVAKQRKKKGGKRGGRT